MWVCIYIQMRSVLSPASSAVSVHAPREHVQSTGSMASTATSKAIKGSTFHAPPLTTPHAIPMSIHTRTDIQHKLSQMQSSMLSNQSVSPNRCVNQINCDKPLTSNTKNLTYSLHINVHDV